MQHTSLNFNKIEVLENKNPEFMKVLAYVCSCGTNRNMTYISKEEIEKALPSMAYIPVVAHLFQKDDGSYIVGGHDMELTVKDGEYVLKDVTVPFGVVIPDSYNWVTQEEYGTTQEYLTVEAYLWVGRYPDLKDAFYSDDVLFNQSMEVGFNDYRPYEGDSNYTELLGLNFSALCLLQKSDDKSENVKPCFMSARVEKFSFDNEFNTLFDEMKKKLAYCLCESNIEKRGETVKMSKEVIDAILTEFNLIMTDLNFEITEDMTEEIFRSKIADYVAEKTKAEIDTANADFMAKFSATYNEKRKAIAQAVSEKSVYEKDEQGRYTKYTEYWLSDFDDIYAYVNIYEYENESCKNGYARAKYEFNDAEKTAALTSDFEEMVIKWLTLDEVAKLEASRNAFEIMSNEFEQYKKDYSVANSEVEELRQFKADTLKAAHDSEVAEVFTQFDEKLADDSEYCEFKSNCSDTDIEVIKNKCFAILGKKLAKFSYEPKKNNSIKIPVVTDSDNSTDDYGDVRKKYLNK